jgi:hypothetical protein
MGFKDTVTQLKDLVVHTGQSLDEAIEENTNNPHFDVNEWVRNTVTELKSKGAVALFLHNSGTVVDNIQFDFIFPKKL